MAFSKDTHSLRLEKSSHTCRSSIDSQERASLDKRIWWKLDLCILPAVTMFYFLSWLDRTNLGNAVVAGLQTDLKMTDSQYRFDGYLHIIGPDVLLPTLLTLWGIVTTVQGVVKTYGGLLICRFFLGLLEGGILPGIVLYLSSFYPREKLQTRISIFISSSSLSGAFSGLLATAIMHLEGKGGHSAWAWIFIIEGAFTAGFGLLSFLILPRSPEQTAFLSAREKNYIILSLRESRAIGENDEADSFSWEEVRKAFFLPQLWLLSCVYFLNGTIIYSLGYFIPSIVHGLGYTPTRTQLMTVGPYGAAFVLTNLASMIADKYRCRGAVGALSSVFCVAGFVIFLASNKTTVMYGSLFLTVGGINCSSPALAAWVANNVSPHVRRATAIAVLAGVTNAGGILSTWLLGTLSTGPRYKSGTITLLAFSVAMSFFISATWWFFFKENRKKEVMRTLCNRADEANGLGDRSAWYTYIL